MIRGDPFRVHCALGLRGQGLREELEVLEPWEGVGEERHVDFCHRYPWAKITSLPP
jgi:hypothetical protein